MSDQQQSGRYFLLGFVIICAIIVMDQFSKWVVVETMLRQGGPLDGGFGHWFITPKKLEFFEVEREKFKTIVLFPFLSFVMVWNQGISFGMLDNNSSSMALILIAVAIFISLLMMVWMALTNKKAIAIPLAMIVGGALANVIDRVRFGAVVDFIDFHAGKHSWPAFNAADSFIVLGATALIVGTLVSKESR